MGREMKAEDMAEIDAALPENKVDAIYTQVLPEKQLKGVQFRKGRPQNVWVVLHKAKVEGAIYADYNIRSRGNDSEIRFSTLRVRLKTDRQRMRHVKMGLVDVRCSPVYADAEALAAWIVRERIHMVTVFFGPKTRWVNDMAHLANHA